MTAQEKRTEMGRAIVKFEGRYKNGKLQVYQLPPGDGGGGYEVAGINERYHAPKAKELRRLISDGKHRQAEDEASAYIEGYTRQVMKFFPDDINADDYPHIEFILRDTAFNRGPKGAATVLQIALGMDKIDGVVGPKTKAEFAKQLKNPGELASKLTKARETYERNSYPWKAGKRDESSKFWKGLSNRWAQAHSSGQTFV